VCIFKSFWILFYLERYLVYYIKALKYYSEDVRLFNKVGTVYYNLKDYDNAMEYYKKAISIDPSYPYPYYNIGLIV